ncbi:MAG TPA: FxLYD domain-containing protein [Thermomicrobiales bacterium]|nr:FxLYD domain-containing protein [Thermomicrobiales bacterium]
MRLFRHLSVLLVTGTLLAACAGGGDGDEAATATVAVASPTTSGEVTSTREPVVASPTARASVASSPAMSTSTPRATVTAPIRPIATQPATATATMSSDEAVPVTLEVVQQGFSEVQSYDEVAYGFIVQNPDAENAVINSEYLVTVFQGADVLDTDSGYLDYVLPGQRLGVGGSIFIPSGRDADSIVVELSAGEAAAPEVDPGFNVDLIRYYPDSLFPSATGVISTTSDVPLQDFEVFAVGYDETGAIVGGGYTFVSFILAGATTGVEVNVASANEPASIELYPVVTSLTIFGIDDTTSPNAEPLVIVADGFGPSAFENELGWGLVVENPNSGLAAETTAYQAIAYAADGSVLGVYSSFISLLLPGERLGLGGSFYLPAGTIAERLEFEVLGRYFSETTIQADFLTPVDVAFVADEFSPRVTGTIQNSLERELSDVEVYAVAYNAAGQIIGGGFTFIDLIDAEGEAAAEVTIAVGEEPSAVELYATVGSLAEIE